PVHTAESSRAELFADVRYPGVHGIPETLRHDTPLWNLNASPLLTWAGLAHLLPRLGVSGLLRPVPHLHSAIALVSQHFPYRGCTPRLHWACTWRLWRRRLFSIQGLGDTRQPHTVRVHLEDATYYGGLF